MNSIPVLSDTNNVPIATTTPSLESASEEKKPDSSGSSVPSTEVIAQAILSPEPTTTGYLRFVNVWLDAERRNLTGPDKDVLVLGAGKRTFDEQEHCCQIAEACQLWNGSRLTVLDSNRTVLDALKSMNLEQSLPLIKTTFKINEIPFGQDEDRSYKRMKLQLTLPIKPKYTLHASQFRMGTDVLAKNVLADVILGTYSLFYPMKEIAVSGTDPFCEKRIELLGHYVSHLKSGGVMYVEKDCLQALLGKTEDFSNPSRLRMLLKAKNINALKVKIAKSMGVEVDLILLPPALGTIYDQQYGVRQPTDELPLFTQTTDVYAIVRR